MKRIMICAALICACNATFAQTNTSTFWGAKASGNANNPCKGATTRVCGTVTSTAKSVSDYSTQVEKSTYDAEGQLTHHRLYIDPRPLEEVLKDFEWEKTGATLPGGLFDGGFETEDPEGNNND